VYLVDTNIVSELRRIRPHGGVLAWLADVPDRELHISAVTLGELQAGVEKTRARDRGKAAAIEAWIDAIARSYQVLPMDGPAFRAYARLRHDRPNDQTEDLMIAATAIIHGLAVVTRNTRDFAPLGVRLVDPFSRRR
jgi:hypothetical protein